MGVFVDIHLRKEDRIGVESYIEEGDEGGFVTLEFFGLARLYVHRDSVDTLIQAAKEAKLAFSRNDEPTLDPHLAPA